MRIMKQGLHIFCAHLDNLVAYISACACSKCPLHMLQVCPAVACPKWHEDGPWTTTNLAACFKHDQHASQGHSAVMLVIDECKQTEPIMLVPRPHSLLAERPPADLTQRPDPQPPSGPQLRQLITTLHPASRLQIKDTAGEVQAETGCRRSSDILAQSRLGVMDRR